MTPRLSPPALTIAHHAIRQDEQGRYCLNDLHHAAGNEPRHRPSRWLESQQTQALAAEAAKAGIPAIQSKQQFGTYVCREMVYAYAMWISPAFSLQVIRAYDALVATPVLPDQAAKAAKAAGKVRYLSAKLGRAAQTTVRKDDLIDLQRAKIELLELKLAARRPV